MIFTKLVFLGVETVITDGSLTVNVDSTSVFELLGVAIAASLIGIVVGTLVSIYKDKEKDQRELVKIKDLIQHDYQTIFSNISSGILSIEKNIATLETSPILEDDVLQKQPQDSIFPEELRKVLVNFQISFYDAIIQSGKLIMLDKSTIMGFQSFHKFIEKQTTPLVNEYTLRARNMRGIRDQNLSVNQTKDQIRNEILNFLHTELFGYKSILDQLHVTSQTMPWIDYEKEPEHIGIT